MSNFVSATENLELTIGKKKVALTPDQYYLLERGSLKPIPVIKHDALVRVAEEQKIKIDKTVLEFGTFVSPDNYCFGHRSFGTLSDGTVVDEVGESNPTNLDNSISSAYPLIMSNKRAQDRLLIRLMGLVGQVYSDVEFNGTKSSDSSEDQKAKEEEITVDDARAMVIDYGRFKGKPITLEELQQKHNRDFDWLLSQTFAAGKMKKLQHGARLLASSATAAN